MQFFFMLLQIKVILVNNVYFWIHQTVHKKCVQILWDGKYEYVDILVSLCDILSTFFIAKFTKTI